MIQESIRHLVIEAEEIAARGGEVNACLAALRRLALDDFGIVFLSMPNPNFPALSKLLPRMTPEEIQKQWTGASGIDLLRLSASFVRAIDAMSWRLTGKGLSGKSVLDFGCGYGRLMRLMYYYTDPENITGVDAWEKSLNFSRDDGVLGALVKSDDVPETLPVAMHDVTYAFSVFTHLSPEAASASLGALHDVTREFLLLTVRPVEFWPFYAIKHNAPAAALTEAHRKHLFAFQAYPGMPDYGEASIHFDYFRQLPQWDFVAYDLLLTEPYQMIVVLRPKRGV